jgi:hypothetical protein
MGARSFFTVVVLFLGLLAPAFAARPAFSPLPPLGGVATRLQIRVVKYTGGVHGRMIVEVKNPAAERESFSAQGLYFVPAVPAEMAPQREGAAGPFEVASLLRPTGATSRATRMARTAIAPGATLRLSLHTFCLDSHRSAPNDRQAFRVARTRLPASLSARIETGAAGILRTHDGNPAAASGAIQNLVWQTRNRSWIVLEGERPGERSAPASRPASGDLIPL